MAKDNVAIVTLGCSKNEIDSELMESILKNNDYNITEELYEATIIIVNTCGFITSSKEQSVEVIWEMTKYKKYGKCQLLILSGCLAQRYPNELLDEINEVDGVIGTGNIKEIVNFINKLKKNKKIADVKNIDSDYVENVRRIHVKYTSYLKIAEGCNNYCSYCIIPKLRGKYRSRTIENIVNEAKYLVSNGAKELILIAQNTTDYGIDIYGEYKLPYLLDELNKIEGLKWIRLLYMYPDNFNKDLIKSIKQNEKVIKYLDIPIQHINNSVLKRMNRHTSKEEITSLIQNLRKEIPNIILRTTIIVGFPGETEQEFNELYNYINEIRFDRLGVFTYSLEEDTKASKFKNQISEKTKEYRKNKIMNLQKNISYNNNKDKMGKTYDVLVEKNENDIYIGRTYMDSPEIDGLVYIKTNKKLNIGSFVKVKITDCLEYDLMGEIEYEFSK